MAEVAAGFLLDSLQQILSYKEEDIVNVKVQIEVLKKELNLFKAFITESKKKRNPLSESQQVMLNNISSVVYKAEDVIDTFMVKQAKFNERKNWGKLTHAGNHSKAIEEVVKEIESLIQTEVKQIYTQKMMVEYLSDKDVLLLPDKDATQRKQPVVEEENVVGFDEEAEVVIGRLNGELEDLDIITIFGMPGLGKTTLAKKIYNDPAIEYEFFTRAWVYVSQYYNKKEVFLSILSSITRKATTDYSNKSDEVIVEELKKFLGKGKYLIVMDDVWTKEDWNDLKEAFPDKKKGSRILITSRHEDVALNANPTGEPHKLKFLSKEESWELFENKVFGKGKCPLGEFHKLGEKIAKECAGLPLAIVVIAGIILNDRGSSDWWKQVSKNVNGFVASDEKQFMDVIAMSYLHLPSHLKSCFLYLGVFPKYYEIPVQTLIRLWIAEGFIERDDEQSLEDIAGGCLADLVNRSLLMVSKRSPTGQIKTCHVHDMLHDFCKKEAKKELFYQEIKPSFEVNPENCTRLCIHSDVDKYIISKPQSQRVRSFLCFALDEITCPKTHTSTIPKTFEFLRVLDIKSIFFEIFPNEILYLALLRYLVLSCKIKALKKDISKLWSMQTLILFTTDRTLKWPEEMWKMYQLRHLHTNASALLPPPPRSTQKINKNMQSLSMISPESCTDNVFSSTPNIKKLGVRGEVGILFDNSFQSVGKLQQLTDLKLENAAATFGGKVLKLPPATKFPKMLNKLTLSNTLLDWGQTEILGNLEMLEVLKLKENAFQGAIWEVKDGGFISLKLLLIGRTDLEDWKASKNHFPSLKHLSLKYCEKLVEVPPGFAEISSFQELELHCTNLNAAKSAWRIHGKKTIKAAKTSQTQNGAFKLSVYPPDNS